MFVPAPRPWAESTDPWGPRSPGGELAEVSGFRSRARSLYCKPQIWRQTASCTYAAAAIFRVFDAVIRAIFWRLEYSAPSLAQMPIPSLAAFLFVRGASCSR